VVHELPGQYTKRVGMTDTLSVFLIDDEPLLLELYKTKFQKEGFTVKTSPSSEDAFNEIAHGYCPAFILFDINMPEHSGYELLEKLISNPALRGVKKIALTNEGQDGSLARIIELGADGYLIKAQYTPGQVVEEVKVLLARH